MGITEKINQADSKKELKKAEKITEKVLALDEKMSALSDEELQGKTDEFKERLKNGETLDDILPEAFAVVREAAWRILGMKHFPVQICGGVILHNDEIAEMKTGEGKTLVCTLPAYLHALEGKGVHVVTVNEYLALRDAQQMGQVYGFLGLTVGVVLSGMNIAERQWAYGCDITYSTNNELGFDYLRDNMAKTRMELVQRGLNYVIIDEVDSVLIDEARTPLIISGGTVTTDAFYDKCNELALSMTQGELTETSTLEHLAGMVAEETGDFVIDEKKKSASLTDEGFAKVEQYFGLENISDPKNALYIRGMMNALKANYYLKKDKDYIVQDDKVMIVDEYTGRVLSNRRLSDGLHQAIESKEHVPIIGENRTLATITFQNFFNKYEHKCGMTGTAKTEENEFVEIYDMHVIEIPTNKPVIRIDQDDHVYCTKEEKYDAVIDLVMEEHKKNRAILIGTTSVNVSEYLSQKFTEHSIPHNVLNAKNHAIEAEIIANAGKAGAITIATNMAGRGTDIILDDTTRSNGGLLVIGTERHDSRRVDNQLRGRSGRQGDPGESVFFLSLEDDLLRLFGSERILEMIKETPMPKGVEIKNKTLTNSIEKAQKHVESNNFGIRQSLLKFDDVKNKQREVIYEERMQVIKSEDVHNMVLKLIESVAENLAIVNLSEGITEETIELFNAAVSSIFGEGYNIDYKHNEPVNYYSSLLNETAVKKYEEKIKDIEEQALPGIFREIERTLFLSKIDILWQQHIENMEILEENIGLVQYGQKDPIYEYHDAGHNMFNEMTIDIQKTVVSSLLNVQINFEEE